MGTYYRGPLPEGEDERLLSNRLKVLACLQAGPTTNKYLASHVGLDYRKRINELRRKDGRHIKSKRISKGLFEYRLLDKPEPLWIVTIKTITPDEQFLIYSIVVNAMTATEARNNAPRKFVRNEILDVRRVAPPDVSPDAPPDVPLPASGAINGIRAALESLQALGLSLEREEHRAKKRLS